MSLSAPPPRGLAADAGYAPSWLDRMLRAVDRLPWPWYASYAAVFILGQAVIAGLRADASAGFARRLLEPPRVFWLWALYLPAFTHYLGRVAREKLLRFREVLALDDDAYRGLAYRLTTMPFWPPLVVGLLSVALGVATLGLNQGLIRELGFPAWEEWATVASYAVGGAAIYHSIHQLRAVSRIYAMVVDLDLHHLEPVHALSALTARTATGWILLLVATQAVIPRALAGRVAVELGFAILILVAAASFFAPLLGMHKRLEQEKAAALAGLSGMARSLRAQLQARIQVGELEGLDGLQKGLAVLTAERDQIARTSTWPWQPATLRGFLSALLLPLIIKLLQGAVGTLLGLG